MPINKNTLFAKVRKTLNNKPVNITALELKQKVRNTLNKNVPTLGGKRNKTMKRKANRQ